MYKSVVELKSKREFVDSTVRRDVKEDLSTEKALCSMMINTFTDLYCRRIGYVDVDATCTTYWEQMFFFLPITLRERSFPIVSFFFLRFISKRVDRFCVHSFRMDLCNAQDSSTWYILVTLPFLCNVPVESRGTSFSNMSTMTSTQCCLPPEKSLKIIRWVEVRPLTPSWCFALSLSLVSSVRSYKSLQKRRWRESWSRSFERYTGAL